MNERIHPLLRELREGLERLYGPRLQGVYLFGSYARGEEDEESDVDVLVVLDSISDYGAEVDRTTCFTSPLSLDHDLSVNCIFTRECDWDAKDHPLLNNVRREGIAA